MQAERIVHPVALRELRVVAVTELTPLTRRVTVGGDQLRGFRAANGIDCGPFVTASPDDHIKIFPPATAGATVLPVQDDGHLDWPSDPPAIARDYTVRHFDPDAGTVDIDVVIHGHGPGSAWGATARPGDIVHIAGPRSSHQHPVHHQRLLFVGDDTALPAIARFVESLRDPSLATVIALADERNHCYPLSQAQVIWIERPAGDQSSAADETVVDRVRHMRLPDGPDTFVWVACEFSLARTLRRVLGEELGLPRERTFVTHYWTRDDADLAVGADRHLPVGGL